MDVLKEILGFLVAHLDLIGLIKDAIDGGADKEKLKAAIKASMVAASDADMKIELGAGDQSA